MLTSLLCVGVLHAHTDDEQISVLDETVLDETVLDETVLDETILDETVLVDSVLTDEEADSIIASNSMENAAKSEPALFVHNPLIAYPGDSINTPQNPYYNYKRDLTYVGVPLFLSSFIIKNNKKGFRSARFSFQNRFKSEIDNYTQYSPYAVLLGCKLAGYQGRSKWGRLAVSALLSNMTMAAVVNSLKYSVKEMRPDNSTRNSFPSGHTATVFTAATVLHKEYGLTRSPWFSIGGYAVATSTGVMRVLNNRHWISDVVAGAGIGILSTELGYFVADLIFKDKGVLRYELDNMTNPDHPSFFDIHMGVGVHKNTLTFEPDETGHIKDDIKLGTSTAFGVETAYFFNKHWGFGLMGRVTSTPAKGLNLNDEDKSNVAKLNNMLADYTDTKGKALPGIYNIYVENGNFNQASLDAGVYYNLPIGSRFSFGAKALCGARFGDGITYKAKNGVPKVDDSMHLVDNNGKEYPIYWYEASDGSQFRSTDLLDPGISEEYNFVLENESEEFDFLNVKGKTAFNYVLGVNFTWHYKTNFAWKVFADFDSAKSTYTYNIDFFSKEAKERIANSGFSKDHLDVMQILSRSYSRTSKHTFNLFTFGGSFSVYF